MSKEDRAKYPLVLVEWYDAESDVSWADTEEVIKWSKKDFISTEVGFIVYEDKDRIVMVSQVGNDGTLGNRTRIPKPWLKSRRKLTDVQKRRRSPRVSTQENT